MNGIVSEGIVEEGEWKARRYFQPGRRFHPPTFPPPSPSRFYTRHFLSCHDKNTPYGLFTAKQTGTRGEGKEGQRLAGCDDL